MVGFRELFHFTGGIPLNLFVRFGSDNRWHFHKCLEVGYCAAGNGELSVQGKNYPLKKGVLFLVNPYVVHSIQNQSADFAMALLQMDFQGYESLCPGITNLDFHSVISGGLSEERLLTLYRFVAAIVYEASNKLSGYLLRTDSLVRALAQFLVDYLTVETRQARGPRSAESDRIKHLIEHIDVHYNEEWSLDELADMVGLNSQYLSRLFKLSVGLPLTKYINSVRVKKSLPDLLDSNKTIAQIAAQHGFQTVKSYYTAFAEVYNLPPGKYKRWQRNMQREKKRLRPVESDMQLNELFDDLYTYIQNSEMRTFGGYGLSRLREKTQARRA